MKKFILLGILAVHLVFGMTLYGNEKEALTGRWTYISGEWIWFFGNSWIIEFKSNGTAISYGEFETGNWSVIDNRQLRVAASYGEIYYFTFEIIGNILIIIDEDEDVGVWRRR